MPLITRRDSSHAAKAVEPAHLFLLVIGGWLLLSGAVGFALDASFPTSPGDVRVGHSYIFGIFETNGWHNLAALLSAVPALAIARWRPQSAAGFALLLGGVNVVVFAAFALWPPSDFLFASNGADQVVHFLTAAGGLATGTLVLSRASRSTTS